jgi:hypothetical protein
VANKALINMEKFRYIGMMVPKQNLTDEEIRGTLNFRDA